MIVFLLTIIRRTKKALRRKSDLFYHIMVLMYLESLSISVPVPLNVFLTMSRLLDCRMRKVLHLSAESWCLGLKSQWVNYLQFPHFFKYLQVQFMMHIRMSQLWPDTHLAEPMLSIPSKGQFSFQPKTPEPTLSRGHPYTSLAAGAGDFQSLIPGNFSFSNKHFTLMIKMEVGKGGGTAATKNPEGKRVFDHSKGKLVNLSWTDFNYVQY